MGRFCSGIAVGFLFAVCTILLVVYQLNKRTTIQMAEELAERHNRSPIPAPRLEAEKL
jgi:hypothetical protein